MTTKHDFVADLADLIRPLTQFESVSTWRLTTPLMTGSVRIDEENSSSVWRFDTDEGFIYCGEPLGPSIESWAAEFQSDEWFDEQHAMGQALHASGRAMVWCIDSAQEGGWKAARDAASLAA